MRTFRWPRGILLPVSHAALMVCVMLASFQLPARADGKERPMEHPTFYRSAQIDGLSIFYGEAGPKDAPEILLLHGLPSSSRMFEPLFARLSDRYHLVAPDHPGPILRMPLLTNETSPGDAIRMLRRISYAV